MAAAQLTPLISRLSHGVLLFSQPPFILALLHLWNEYSVPSPVGDSLSHHLSPYGLAYSKPLWVIVFWKNPGNSRAQCKKSRARLVARHEEVGKADPGTTSFLQVDVHQGWPLKGYAMPRQCLLRSPACKQRPGPEWGPWCLLKPH